jgi:integrase
MAYIRKRGSSWEAMVRKNEFRITRTFDTELQARAWAADIELQILRGTYSDPKKLCDSMKFSDLLQRYAEKVTPTKKGARQELSRIKGLQKQGWISKPIAKLCVSDFSDYKVQRVKQISNSTLNRELALLSAVLNHARREWGMDVKNFVLDIKKPKENSARKRIFSEEELDFLSDAVAKSRSESFKLYFHIALTTGFRKSEILALRTKHINLQEGTVFLPMTKNGESRVAPIGAKAREVFETISDKKLDELFGYEGSDPFKKAWYAAISRAINAYIENCEKNNVRPRTDFLQDVRFHDLRHHAFTKIAKVVKGYNELSLITGHKSPQMIGRYVHLTPAQVALDMP